MGGLKCFLGSTAILATVSVACMVIGLFSGPWLLWVAVFGSPGRDEDDSGGFIMSSGCLTIMMVIVLALAVRGVCV